jgi:hypothetical protein
MYLEQQLARAACCTVEQKWIYAYDRGGSIEVEVQYALLHAVSIIEATAHCAALKWQHRHLSSQAL